MKVKVEIVRSRRKTISMELRPEGRLIVRAPLRMPAREIEAFVETHSDWIEKKLKKLEQRKSQRMPEDRLTREDIDRLAQEALAVLPQKAALFAPKVGVTYKRITIRNQKTRWGSCSAKGNLNFNCLLMLTPEAVQDYVVVHELCHLKEMNHSPRFWAEVERVLPDYKTQRKWLKDHGGAIIQRMTMTD